MSGVRIINRVLLVLFVGISFSGCAHWDRTDKALFAGLAAGCIADVATTRHILNDGGEEKNPVLDGNAEMIIPLNLVALGAVYFIADQLSPTARKWLLGLANGIKWGCVVHNANEL